MVPTMDGKGLVGVSGSENLDKGEVKGEAVEWCSTVALHM